MHLPPSNVSSASRCVFRFATRLPPPDLSPAPASRGMSRLPQHILSPVVQLVSRSSRFGSSPLPTSRGITRHHATYRDVPRSPRYLAPPASLLLPTRLSRDIPRPPAAPASVAPVPSLGYPMTSRDPVASPAAPCEIHDTTTSSGPLHYPPTSLLSDPTSPVMRPALPHYHTHSAFRSRPAPAPALQLLVSRSYSAPFRFMLVSPFWGGLCCAPQVPIGTGCNWLDSDRKF